MLIKDRINLWFERANATDLSEGEKAYPCYRDVMQDFADFWGFGIVPATEAFVALSPNNDYFGNLRSLASVLHHCRTGDDGMTMKDAAFAMKGKGHYLKLEGDFRSYARRKGMMKPHALQATLWLCRKRVLAIKSTATQGDFFFGSDDVNKISVSPKDCQPYGDEKWEGTKQWL